MTKARDDSYCRYSAAAVRQRVAAVASQAARVGRTCRAGGVCVSRDTEAIHDLRVASRRLRSALAIFEPCRPAKVEAWRNEMCRLTRALGQARDLDVQITCVEEITKALGRPEARPGLNRLLQRLRQQRRAAQHPVKQALGKMERSKVLGTIDRCTCEWLMTPADQGPDLAREARCRVDQPANLSRTAQRQAGRTIAALLKKLLRRERCVTRPAASRQHHRMRIAAKRLRYAMEIFEPVFGGGIGPSLIAARKLQTLLGELHDCDVWIEFLPEFLAKEQAKVMTVRARARSAAPVAGGTKAAPRPAAGAKAAARLAIGLEALRHNRQQEREMLYRRFVRYWKRLRKDETWSKLRTVLAGG